MKRWVSLSFALVGCASSAVDVAPTPVVEDPVGEARGIFETEVARMRSDGNEVDWARVAKSMTRATALHPGFTEAWFNLGVARTQLDDAEGAAEAYQTALVQRPEMSAAGENLAVLHLQAGRTREAVLLLERIVQQDPAAASARVALASHRMGTGDLEEVERLCREALTYDPTAGEAYCLLASVAVERQDWGRVRLLVSQGLKLDAETACLHEALGQSLLSEGEPASALTAFERATKASSGRVSAHASAGQLALSVKDYAVAASHFGAITKLRPDLPAAWTDLAVSLKASGQVEAAHEAYLRALELDPQQGAAHFGLGVLQLRHLGDLERAEAHLRKALQTLDERSDEAYALLQELQVRREQQNQAAVPDPAPDDPVEVSAPPVQRPPEPKPKSKPRPRRKKPKAPEPLVLPSDDDFE
ncbi:MAG: tetratricopeptide repeat protein [Myxococcota bacterium]